MPKLVILGSANAVPDEQHENTHLALLGHNRTLLIDCVNSPIVRLERAGVNLDTLTDLILTHYHPDHVSGVPSLLMGMWLLGRTKPLNIYGLKHTLKRVKAMMKAYDWQTWPRFFPVLFTTVPEQTMTLVLEQEEWRIFSSPVNHMIPNIGLRIEFLQKKVVAYSSDTEPCPAVIQLAQGAEVLIHEAAGNSPGHTSPAQAGEIAQEANVKSLYLIHYPAREARSESLIAEAASTFDGQVVLAEDFMKLEF
jgi:ribonuclease Z